MNNEPAACLSPNPSAWPAPSKPYFMLAIDTSGSMAQNVVPAVGNSCTFGQTGTTRIDHARCAIRKTIQAFGGQVNFGLSSFNTYLGGCNATCYQPPFVFSPPSGCGPRLVAGDENFGCGPEADKTQPFSADRRGANILVPMQQDDYWSSPQQPTNVSTLLSYVDNDCTNNVELYAGGGTASNGILRDLHRYFSGSWTSTDGTRTYATPLGALAQGERPCRSVNIIFMTDGDEDCDLEGFSGGVRVSKTAAEDAAEALLTGFTIGGITWHVKTYVIRFAGGSQINTDAVAAAGGTGSSIFASNEVGLSTALAQIISNAIQPETCDNTDNNCNGCTDEGFKHYCDVQPIATNCCSLPRATCLSNYTASITAANPQGDLTLLPCTDANAGSTPSTWLCYNPGDRCDDVDNNCDGTVDEGQIKCGNPAHCPTPEICNGIDDDCDGAVDENGMGGSVCPGTCVPSPEICDGCDNDCDGIVDNGVPNAACGIPANPPVTPTYCSGVLTCQQSPTPVPPGSCLPGGGQTTCSNAPQAEVCNGVDDDCDGIVDDGIPSASCVPAGAPPGLVYDDTFPASHCKKGQSQCINGVIQCVGWVGPSAEICDGVDNDCDGAVDDGVPGTGQPCGNTLGACSPGTTACVGGALVCSGGVGPQPEICDGIDNDCNGLVDDGALLGAPAAPGCWDQPGSCCSFSDTQTGKTTVWCPPSGAGCNDLGMLTTPCALGVLACAGAAGWVCSNAKSPSPEVCDGADNDCDGLIDDAITTPPVGNPCGTDVGECTTGVNVCIGGQVVCSGVGPMPEACDGKDNDCNGVVDDNITGLGTPCTIPYDTTAFPGPRTALPCKPGILQCDGMGNLVCVGGVGPQPEICDGIDNDCDGQKDEVGAAPDGINGTPNPIPPAANIGDPCGGTVGECTPGTWACANGFFVCSGGVSPQPESCDCKDNDCDGSIDNPNPNDTPLLCGAGSDCVQSAIGCGCATPCDLTKEFPCPGGQSCIDVTVAGQVGTKKYCVADACSGGCATQKVMGAGGAVICAPASEPPDPTTCAKAPVCVCAGPQIGCKNPCFGVSCQPGTVCAESGPNAGKCVADTCFNNPCAGCDKICNGGVCQANPCKPDSCPGQGCRPSADYTMPTCFDACGDKVCAAGQTCVDGGCVASCDEPCGPGETCDRSTAPPACVTDKCNPSPCTDGSYCNPVTGACGNDPCTGVICPTGMVCQAGQCVAGSSSSSSSSSSGMPTTTGSGGGSGAGGAPDKGVWGLATGGGGCACDVGGGDGLTDGVRWALLAIAATIGRQRRRSRRGAGREEVAR